MARTRQPVKPLQQSAAQVREAAKAEADRKKASKAALKEGRPTSKKPVLTQAKSVQPDPAIEAKRAERAAQDRANAIAAHWVDFVAIGVLEVAPETPDTLTGEGAAAWASYLAEQGVALDGAPAPTSKAGTEKPHYTGPMLALRERQKAGAYVKMANGNPSCNDGLAIALGGLNRDQVVQVLIAAMKLEGNPYSHLNPGQQSMNLRNKARGMVKNGLLQVADVVAAIEHASRKPE